MRTMSMMLISHFEDCRRQGKGYLFMGGFYDNYASQSKDERALFLSDLEAKKYSRLLYLLTQSDYRFEKIDGIGGFR